jgi:hypothetical protein
MDELPLPYDVDRRAGLYEGAPRKIVRNPRFFILGFLDTGVSAR